MQSLYTRHFEIIFLCENVAFWLKFHWFFMFCSGPNLQLVSISSDNGLAQNRSIIWSNAGLVYWRIYIYMQHAKFINHYDDVIMGAIASQITSITIVYSTVCSGADQRKRQSSASLAFVWGIHRGPVNSPHKWPVTRKIFPFNDVIMNAQWFVPCCMMNYVTIGSERRPQAILRTNNNQRWTNTDLFDYRLMTWIYSPQR